MAENFEADQQDSIADTQPNLSQLKKQVQLTPSTLKEITYKQQFIERVVELSNNAKESVNIQRAKQALIYLNQAQKILQYAASCGKTIDKNIIISVLHNIACCYQKVWQLQKCSQYLEALIYNFNSFMKVTDQNSSSEDGSYDKIGKQKSKKVEQLIMIEMLQKRTFLAKYYLQFCAVNSQTDNHSGALVAGRKSIQIMKNIFRQLADYTPYIKKMTYQKKSEYQYKIKLIMLGSRLNDSININHYQNIFQAAKYYLRQWKINKDNKQRPDRNYVLQQEFKNYSIGNAMQIVALGHKDFQLKQQKTFTSKMILEKIILMALGYFTISTQLRLIANKKINKKQGSKCNNAEFKQSQIYHLLSIVIAASCIPFEILYMKHVLSSYNNHYGNDLLVQNQSESKIFINNFQQIVFPLPKQSDNQNKKYMANNSLTESISHEQTISKYQKEDNPHNISNQKLTHRRNQSNFKEQDLLKIDGAKKMKLSVKGKNKSKSKIKSMHFIGVGDKSQKASPIPKSPQIHMKSPSSKNNLVKVKTSYKLKVSTEKIVTTTNPTIYKDEKSKKKKQTKETRAENIQIDYYMGRSKDLKKPKKYENTYNLNSPRVNSKSSSRRQSPLPKYFQSIKSPLNVGVKTLKSPKKPHGGLKSPKSNLYQHYS